MDEQIQLTTNEPWQRIKSGQLLQVIRERPALYLGERSLTALWHYLQGFWMALSVHDLQSEYILPLDFHEWVAYCLHFRESTSGYKNMILARVCDESAALDRFFQLLDEHRGRKPRAVARLDGYNREYKQASLRHGVLQDETVEKFPPTLTLISYTDDPGFFVGSDCPGPKFPGKDRFFPTLRWFEMRFSVKKENLKILEPDIYSRWLSEEGRFETER